MRYFLGVDVGTTSLKAALFDDSGTMIAVDWQEYTLETPYPTIIEFEAEIYWRVFCQVVNNVVYKSNILAKNILSICISSQGETLIALDSNGLPTRKAIVWLDNRAQSQADQIKEKFGADLVYQRTGQPDITPTWPACKILWIKQNEQDVFARSTHFLLLEDYLLFRITHEYVTEMALQTSSIMLDLNTHDWWAEMLEFIGINRDQLGNLLFPGDAIGQLSLEGAECLGLTPTTLAIAGSLDQVMCAIGTGNIMSGSVTESTGGALGVIYTCNKPMYDPKKRLPCHYHARKGYYALLPWNQTGGMALRWFRDNFIKEEFLLENKSIEKAYDFMTRLAENIPPGSNGLIFLPHLEGATCPEYNPLAKGVFFGLTLMHTRPHLIRSVLESVAFMLKRDLDLIEEFGGSVYEIRCTGGGAKSRLWLQIKADVLQKQVIKVDIEESACLGAAVLGSIATGSYKNIEEGVSNMVKLGTIISPNIKNQAKYDEGYSKYIKLYETLLPMFK
jgi:xylulokinase